MSSYKETLHLPSTAFPMKADLPRREPALLERWERERLYERIQQARAEAPLFVLHDGPPFANGDVHMGTALNKILKDFVIKTRTMLGYRAPFVPGWDCHGLPIEYKVVKEARGLNPAEVRRRSEACAREFIEIQKGQFRRLGVLGDWSHPYLTLEPSYEAEILRAFAKLVARGLVYRSRKPVHWSIGARTALAEAEIEYRDKVSTSVTVRFPLQKVSEPLRGGSIAVWTTTPWTLPANLALAVHPDWEYVLADFGPPHGRLVVLGVLLPALSATLGAPVPPTLYTFRGSDLEGATARHPFLPRESPIFTAPFVTQDTGTGVVHIAPGHGEEDYLLGREKGLEILSPVDDGGCFTSECGVPELAGRNVFDANARIVEILRERGMLLACGDFSHSYPHCWRSKTPVIFRAIEQFFIRVDALRSEALQAIAGTKWIPAWGMTRIRDTVAARPDWCISRQRAWGVPLPVFYTPEGEPILDAHVAERVADVVAQKGSNAWFELSDEEWARLAGLPPGVRRGLDTLDVWIDSGVSHQAVLRRHPALSFPADLYLEATDQHRGWFQSSLMMAVALESQAPYRAVFTHGFVVDVDTRKKLSKSAQGGYARPMNVSHFVEKYGADLVRWWVASVTATDDVPFSEEIFTRLADSYRRIRNTLRILLANGGTRAEGLEPLPGATLVDRWILARTGQLAAAVRRACEHYEFHKASRALADFCAVELSSLYVDITKDRLYCDHAASPRRLATRAAMRIVFDRLCRMLAPFLAFTAEEAWSHFEPSHSVHLEMLPPADEFADSEAVSLMNAALEARQHITRAVESLQKSGTIGAALEARIMLTLPPGPLLDFHRRAPGELEELFILSELDVSEGPELAAKAEKISSSKCQRCWRHRPEVGRHPTHPGLCSRCLKAIGESESPLPP